MNQSNFDKNISSMYGYSRACAKHIGQDLRNKLLTPIEAAERLEALHATMEWLWESKDEDFSGHEGDTGTGVLNAISKKFREARYEVRDKRLGIR